MTLTARQFLLALLATSCTVALSWTPPAMATSGWDRFDVPISGGYHLRARAVAVSSLHRDGDETKNLLDAIATFIWFYAIWDTDDKLFLVHGPDQSWENYDGFSVDPYPDMKLYVFDKQRSMFEGPWSTKDLEAYCGRNALTFPGWTVVSDLFEVERARRNFRWQTFYRALSAGVIITLILPTYALFRAAIGKIWSSLANRGVAA